MTRIRFRYGTPEQVARWDLNEAITGFVIIVICWIVIAAILWQWSVYEPIIFASAGLVLVTVNLIVRAYHYHLALAGKWHPKEHTMNRSSRYCLNCNHSTGTGDGLPFICGACVSRISSDDQGKIEKLAKRFKVMRPLFPIIVTACVVVWIFTPIFMRVVVDIPSDFRPFYIWFLITLPLQGLFGGLGPLLVAKNKLQQFVLDSFTRAGVSKINLTVPISGANVSLPAAASNALTCWKCSSPMASIACPNCHAWTCPSCKTNNESDMERCMFCDAQRPAT